MPASFPRSLPHSFAAGVCAGTAGGHGKSYFLVESPTAGMCVVPAPLCCPRLTCPGTWPAWLSPPWRTSGCRGRFPGGHPPRGSAFPPRGSPSTPGFSLSTPGLSPQLSPAGRSAPVRRLVLERGRSAQSESRRQDEGRGKRRQITPLPWPTAGSGVAVSGPSRVVSDLHGLSTLGWAWPMPGWTLVPWGRRRLHDGGGLPGPGRPSSSEGPGPRPPASGLSPLNRRFLMDPDATVSLICSAGPVSVAVSSQFQY